MAEQAVLVTPEAKPSNLQYQVRKMEQYYEPPDKSWYTFLLIGGDGVSLITYNVVDREIGAYGTGTAANLATQRIKAFNTTNFATKSMQRRVLELAGTDINPATRTPADPTGKPFLPPSNVTGTPDP